MLNETKNGIVSFKNDLGGHLYNNLCNIYVDNDLGI